MMSLAVGSSWRRCATVLAGVCASLLCAATFAAATGNAPYAIAVDSVGNIYTANIDSNNVSKITPDGTSTILGTTRTGPLAIAVDSAGNIYTATQS